MVKTLGSFVVLFLAAACGGGSEGSGVNGAGSSPPPAGNTPVDGGSKLFDGLSFNTGAFDVPTGDSFECFFTGTVTTEVLNVNSAYGRQGPGGHHITLYYSPSPQPVGHHPCKDEEMVSLQQVTAIAGDGQAGGETLVLPDGYASKIPSGAQLVIQSHYINTAAPLTATDWITLRQLKSEDVKAFTNGFILMTTGFEVPAKGSATVAYTCSVPDDLQILGLVGHMHEQGTHFTLERVDEAGNTLETLYDHPWQAEYTSHPPVNNYGVETPLRLAKGTRLRETCSWNNPTNDPLRFPTEMCITFTHYFPDQGQMLQCQPEQ